MIMAGIIPNMQGVMIFDPSGTPQPAPYVVFGCARGFFLPLIKN
jgi:hypothetical protein